MEQTTNPWSPLRERVGRRGSVLGRHLAGSRRGWRRRPVGRHGSGYSVLRGLTRFFLDHEGHNAQAARGKRLTNTPVRRMAGLDK